MANRALRRSASRAMFLCLVAGPSFSAMDAAPPPARQPEPLAQRIEVESIEFASPEMAKPPMLVLKLKP